MRESNSSSVIGLDDDEYLGLQTSCGSVDHVYTINNLIYVHEEKTISGIVTNIRFMRESNSSSVIGLDDDECVLCVVLCVVVPAALLTPFDKTIIGWYTVITVK